MEASVDAQLQADSVAFTAADAALLRAVDDAGSVRAASDSLGRSRARALTRIDDLESVFGSLVERRRGGESGGGSELTETAEALLARFARLQAALARTASVEASVVCGTVTDRDGELGVVTTDSVDLRARLVATTDERPDVGDSVRVSVRSDAVTVHDPADAPAPDATSARNRFEGTIVDVDRGAAVGEVAVDIGTADPVVALLTAESFDRLDPKLDSSVVVSFKATATQAFSVE